MDCTNEATREASIEKMMEGWGKVKTSEFNTAVGKLQLLDEKMGVDGSDPELPGGRDGRSRPDNRVSGATSTTGAGLCSGYIFARSQFTTPW
jgi:hypothetical protein